MGDDRDLAGYLDRLEAAGASAGEASFTIDRQKAWEKLGGLQLSQPHLWVLKVVQAAVAGRAESLEIAQSSRETSFVVRSAPDWNREGLHSAALLSARPRVPGLEHLAVAVRALAKGTELPFVLGYPDGVREAWTGERFCSQGEVGRNSTFALTVGHHRLGERRDSDSAVRAMSASIARYLTSYAYPSPIPVRLDSRLINGIENDPEFGVSPHAAVLTMLEIPPSEVCPALTVVTSPELAQREEFRLASGWTQERDLCRVEVGGLGLVTAHFKQSRSQALRAFSESAHLLWIQDGVVVHRDRLWYSGPVSVGVFVNASGLETDLSGLDLTWSDERARRRDYVIGGINGRLGRLEHQSKALQERALRHWGGEEVGLLNKFGRWLQGRGFPMGVRERRGLKERVEAGITSLRRGFVE